MQTLNVSTSPHIRDADSTARIMWSVVLALVPAFIGALFIFGWYAGAVVLTCVLACLAVEGVIQLVTKQLVTLRDGSAVVTGMLLAFVLPPDVPMWVPVVGAVVAIGLAKHLFGGLGHNIWNPALVGRAVLQLSFPEFLNRGQWPVLRGAEGSSGLRRLVMNIADSTDAVTQASPLSLPSSVGIERGFDPSFTTAAGWKLWLGFEPGCLGETSFLLLALGGIALILLKRVKWQVPAFYIATVALVTWILPYSKTTFETPAVQRGFFAGDPLYHVAFGGLALGAFFMATDMVTTPLTTAGQVIFAVGCGLLTAVIRLFGGYPEGVCYSILLMNSAVPLIDRATRPRVFGTGRLNKLTAPGGAEGRKKPA